MPAGVTAHTCAALDGDAWHGSAETAYDFALHLDESRQLFDADYVVPLEMRSDDAACSPLSLWARVTISGN